MEEGFILDGGFREFRTWLLGPVGLVRTLWQQDHVVEKSQGGQEAERRDTG
jgi:hypothetical protein